MSIERIHICKIHKDGVYYKIPLNKDGTIYYDDELDIRYQISLSETRNYLITKIGRIFLEKIEHKKNRDPSFSIDKDKEDFSKDNSSLPSFFVKRTTLGIINLTFQTYFKSITPFPEFTKIKEENKKILGNCYQKIANM